MALDVGQDFKKRWLNTPEVVRQTYLDNLARICELLLPETTNEIWQTNEKKAEQHDVENIEQAYAELKANLLEQARIRKQHALEKALAQKREQQAQYAASLQADEAEKFEQQTQALIALRGHLHEEIVLQTARYQKNVPPTPVLAKASTAIADQEITSGRESLQIRLELEADSLIEQTLIALREKLHSAAKEEIDYILKNTVFKDETRD